MKKRISRATSRQWTRSRPTAGRSAERQQRGTGPRSCACALGLGACPGLARRLRVTSLGVPHLGGHHSRLTQQLQTRPLS